MKWTRPQLISLTTPTSYGWLCSGGSSPDPSGGGCVSGPAVDVSQCAGGNMAAYGCGGGNQAGLPCTAGTAPVYNCSGGNRAAQP
jgi:hypothetical protein